jgi:predicted outer membrane protein
VKQFAEQMVQDHTQFLSKLAPYAGMNASPTADGTPTTQDQSSTRANETNQTAQRANPDRQPALSVEPGRQGASVRTIRQGGGAELEQLANIERTAAQQCLAMTTAMLQEKQGAQFDRCYVGQQIGAHVAMLAKLKAIEPQVSGDLQQLVRDGRAKTEEHLQHAKSLAQSLESQSGSNTGEQQQK